MSRWPHFLTLLILPAAVFEYDPPPIQTQVRSVMRSISTTTVLPRTVKARPSGSAGVSASKTCPFCSEATLTPVAKTNSPLQRSVRGRGRQAKCRP